MIFTMGKSEGDLSTKRCPVCDEGVREDFIERSVFTIMLLGYELDC
jgi:hypothetical protein